MNTDYEETEIYCSICGVASNAPPDVLCERHGKKPIPTSRGRYQAIHAANAQARTTGKRWVVIFAPGTGSFTACAEDVFKCSSPNEPHMISDIADPFHLKPRLHLSPARVTTARPDSSTEAPKVPGRTGTTR